MNIRTNFQINSEHFYLLKYLGRELGLLVGVIPGQASPFIGLPRTALLRPDNLTSVVDYLSEPVPLDIFHLGTYLSLTKPSGIFVRMQLILILRSITAGVNFYHPKSYESLCSNCLWKSRCTSKLKEFAWLLFNDCLNTMAMLYR